MRTAIGALALGATILLAASAVPVEAQHQVCTADLKALCAKVTPGEGRVRECLISHMEGLSFACIAKLSKSAFVAKQCEPDITRFCGRRNLGQKMVSACMHGHLGELTIACKRALAFLAAPGKNP
jgi:hypothetical protein